MVTILPPKRQKNDLGAQIGASFGAGLGEGLNEQLKKHKENKALKALSEGWNPDTPPIEMMKSVIQATDLNPNSQKMAMTGIGMLMQQQKAQQELDYKMKALEQKQKQQSKLSPVAKKIEDFKADSIVEYMKGGDDTTNLKKNLDWLEENIGGLGRSKAFFGAQYGPNKSAQFMQAENRGNLVLDGVIKVFNKAGVLPQKKLEWIRDNFAISPYDTQKVMQGRIDALRSLEQSADIYQKSIGSLLEIYGENIPTKEFLKVRKGLEKSIDNIKKPIASNKNKKSYNTLPKDAILNKPYINTETGERRIKTKTGWKKL